MAKTYGFQVDSAVLGYAARRLSQGREAPASFRGTRTDSERLGSVKIFALTSWGVRGDMDPAPAMIGEPSLSDARKPENIVA